MTQPTVPLDNRELLWHWHHMLTCHLPRMDSTLQRFQELLITNHIGEVAVEMRTNREAKVLAR